MNFKSMIDEIMNTSSDISKNCTYSKQLYAIHAKSVGQYVAKNRDTAVI